jgi:hypothetical protein
MRQFKLAGARIEIHEDRIVSTYSDSAVSFFYPPTDDPEFCSHAREFGYLDAMQYGIEHDIAHHVMSAAVGLQHSPVIWCDAHKDWKLYPKRALDDDEHRANRFLRFINTGQLDDDFGILLPILQWRPSLPLDFLSLARPWLWLVSVGT